MNSSLSGAFKWALGGVIVFLLLMMQHPEMGKPTLGQVEIQFVGGFVSYFFAYWMARKEVNKFLKSLPERS